MQTPADCVLSANSRRKRGGNAGDERMNRFSTMNGAGGGTSLPGNPCPAAWWQASDIAHAPRLEGAASADVAVIGGGFAGLSCARHLKEASPSLDVALVEREFVGFGASGRNAGVLSPFVPLTWLIDCRASPRRLDDIRFAVRYIQEETQALTRLIQREAIPCDLRATSIVTTGAGVFHQQQLRLIAERCLLAGIKGHLATPEELQSTIPYPAHGGYVLEGYAVQPMALAQGLRRYILQLGTRLYENTRVTRIRPAIGGVEVITGDDACLKAGKVIISTNAYTHQLNLDSRQHIPGPIYTYLLATAPLDQAQLDRLKFKRQTIGDIGHDYFYARLHQNRLLFGGLDRPILSAEDQVNRDMPYYRRLRAEMFRRFPFLAGTSIDAEWGGPYHATRTQVPIIRRLERMPDVIMNIGYGGVGVTLTQFSGRLLGSLILGHGRQDPDSDRMLAIYATSRYPVKEGLKLAWRLAQSLIVPGK